MAVSFARRLRQWLCLLDGVVFHEQCRVCFNLLPPAALAQEYYLLPVDEIPKTICAECWRCVASTNPVLEECVLGNRALPIASGGLYVGAMKRLVYKLKYDDDRLLAYDLALIAARAWPLLNVREALLVPIPLHADRLWERGYNQAEEIAKHLARRFELQMEKYALQRLKKTQPQFGLNRMQRMENLSKAFSGNLRAVTGKNIVLVDDVYTSGATLTQAAQAILSAGAASVSAITASRAVAKDSIRRG